MAALGAKIMLWKQLKLWADEEQHIQKCLQEALYQLIARHIVKATDGEKTITGKFRPILKSVRKEKKLEWTFHPETSAFMNVTDADPVGHPDIRFSRLDKDNNQYDYDIECKLVRLKRQGKAWDYCSQYINEGVVRYINGKYAQSEPPMGTMLGYIQEGEISALLDKINKKVTNKDLSLIKLHGSVINKGVTTLSQKVKRRHYKFILSHLWADFR